MIQLETDGPSALPEMYEAHVLQTNMTSYCLRADQNLFFFCCCCCVWYCCMCAVCLLLLSCMCVCRCVCVRVLSVLCVVLCAESENGAFTTTHSQQLIHNNSFTTLIYASQQLI